MWAEAGAYLVTAALRESCASWPTPESKLGLDKSDRGVSLVATAIYGCGRAWRGGDRMIIMRDDPSTCQEHAHPLAVAGLRTVRLDF